MAAERTRSRGRTNEKLARRKAALERAASRMAGQRQEAAEAEARRLRQEAAYDELVADFELAVEEEQGVAADVEEEVRRVRERGQVRIDAARVAAARVVLAMGAAGETVAGCGRRLGVGADRIKELRRLGRDAAGEAEEAEERGERGEAGEAGERGAGQDAGGRWEGRERAADGAAPGPSGSAVVAVGAARGAPAAVPGAGPSETVGAEGSGGGGRPGWPEAAR
ncbi:hypothetical protein OG458_42330 (plasmid) [Streptomyces sp. NBC_01281]|uniref:hypothetical protein n=1 Tax=Streptomyces sp. NBC_01281 TaxID=2903811 RepID=UPI002E0E8866|nr:hypothetical protein OG458_41475 [Streptomyces sp. NBC_01281]WSK66595.1 hypothetical protein OG458_42330 [Streptomyces sp. NBC_01281]